MKIEVKRLENRQIPETYRTLVRGRIPAKREKTERLLRYLMIHGQYRAYGLFAEEELLAAAFVYVTEDKNFRLGMLDSFAVAEERKDQGVAPALFARLRDCLKEEGELDGIFIELPGVNGDDEEVLKDRSFRLAFYRSVGAYLTDTISELTGSANNVLYLPAGPSYTLAELYEGTRRLYDSILPTFRSSQWLVRRLGQ